MRQLPQRTADAALIEAIRTKFPTCHSIDALAQELGCSRSTVYKHSQGLVRIEAPRTIPEAIAKREERMADTSSLIASAIASRSPLEMAWRPE